jgi:micrococcal nuclease
MYEYRANVVRVVDGDTLHIDLDLGIDCHTLLTVRLWGVNAPEHGTPEGDAATAYVENWVHNHAGPGGLVEIATYKDRKEKYGRYLGTILGWAEGIEEEERASAAPDRSLNAMLVEAGHAVEYDGGKR